MTLYATAIRLLGEAEEEAKNGDIQLAYALAYIAQVTTQLAKQ